MNTENNFRNAVNISPLTEFYRTTTMAFSGEDVTAVTVDGYGQVLFTVSGVEGVIGAVAPDVMAEGKPIIRNLTIGDPVVGMDQIISGTLAQTTPTDISNMAGAIALDKVRIIGQRNTIVMTPPSGRKLYMNFDLSMKFDNKSDSGMKFTVTRPATTVASLTSFVVVST